MGANPSSIQSLSSAQSSPPSPNEFIQSRAAASTTPVAATDILEAKEGARSSRLQRTNSIKNRIWSEWQKSCLRVCDDDVARYWVCRQEQGMMTVLNCRAENDGMKSCLQKCGRDQTAFDAFRAKRLDEIEAQLMSRKAER